MAVALADPGWLSWCQPPNSDSHPSTPFAPPNRSPTLYLPELFVRGSEITTAVDVYAFGIMMYELFSKQGAYAGG